MKLLKFEKASCRPCAQVSGHLQENGIDLKEVQIVNPFGNAEGGKLALQYNIGMQVPVTILLDDNGKEITRTNGFNEDELDAIIVQYKGA